MNKQCPACGRYMAFPEKAICSICEWDRETKKNRKAVYAKQMVRLVDKEVPKTWLNEYERRVLFKDGSVGRRGDSGKIQEREIDLHR